MVFSQYIGASEKQANGWAKLDNGLVVVWGSGKANGVGGQTNASTGPCSATLPLKMKSIYVGLGNLSSGLGAVLGIELSTTGTTINGWWDSCGYRTTTTSWRYIVIGVPANPV